MGAWLAVWQLAALAVGSELLLAGPARVLARLLELASGVPFWRAVATTLAHVSAGFTLGFALALALGALAREHPLVAEVLSPPVSVLRSAPIVCVIVLLLLWVGSRGVSAAAAFLVTFPAVYFAMLEGLAAVDGQVSEMLRAFRVPPARRALAHTWPSLVPYLCAASESALGMAWKAGVAAELVGAPAGTVGERVYQAKLLLETADVLAWTLVVIVLAAACSRAFARALRRSADVAPALAVRLALRTRPREGAVPRAVELVDVTAGYGSQVVLERLTLGCAPGERMALTDASGSGKTTLLRVVARILPPLAGSVEAGPVSVVFQEARLVEPLSVAGNVALACGAAGAGEPLARALAEALPGVDPVTPVRDLSGGQRRRVELVRALLAPSSAVLLDEPFASLDGAAREACCRLVDRLLAGRPLLVATHDARDVALLCATPASVRS